MTALATLNQVVQIGVESTPGTTPGGGANRLLRHLTYNIDPDFQDQLYRGSGQRFDSVQTLKMEMAKFKIGGPISYTELAYPFAGLWGQPVITTPTNGVNARQLAFSPKLTGVQGGVTLYGQNGATAADARAFNYMTQTGIDLTFKRSGDSVISGGDGFAQLTQYGVALTSSPTSQLQIPAPPVQFNCYLDTSSANIGTTLVGQCLEAQFKTSGWYTPVWFLNRALASFGGTVDTPPKTTCLLRIIPDASVAPYWIAARAAATAYIRLQGVGNPVDNAYTLNGSVSYSAGTFTLSYKGQTTAPIAFNALGSAIQTALQALSSIGSNVTVSPSGTAFNTATTFTITFSGVLANDPSVLTANFSLTGGAPALTSIVVNNTLTIDMAAKYRPRAYNDDGGAWVQDWEFAIVGDTGWTEAGAGGTAIYAALINTMTAL